MIKFQTGNIFNSKAQCLVNPVNCIGVMGKGLALEFKRRFPTMFDKYRSLCFDGSLHPGQIGFYVEKSKPDKIICLFPTKNHWREKSTIQLIDLSLKAFVKYAPQMDIKSVAFPKVGCGEGGLSFEHQVKPLLEKYFTDSPYTVTVYI